MTIFVHKSSNPFTPLYESGGEEDTLECCVGFNTPRQDYMQGSTVERSGRRRTKTEPTTVSFRQKSSSESSASEQREEGISTIGLAILNLTVSGANLGRRPVLESPMPALLRRRRGLSHSLPA